MESGAFVEIVGAIAAAAVVQIAVFLVAWGTIRERVNTHERRIGKVENEVDDLRLKFAAMKGES